MLFYPIAFHQDVSPLNDYLWPSKNGLIYLGSILSFFDSHLIATIYNDLFCMFKQFYIATVLLYVQTVLYTCFLSNLINHFLYMNVRKKR